MARVLSVRGTAADYGLAVAGGTNGLYDDGHFADLTTFPHPSGTGTGIVTQWTSPQYPGQSAINSGRTSFKVGTFAGTFPHARFYLGANKFDPTIGTPLTTYSVSILVKINGPLGGADVIRRILGFDDAANALSWSVAIQGFTLGDEQYTGNKVQIRNHTNGLVNGGSSTLLQNTWHKLEIQVQPTGTKVTVRIYRFVSASGTWNLVATRSGSPANTACRSIRVGWLDTMAAAVGMPNLNIHDMEFANLNVWDTYDADGNFPNWDMPPKKGRFSVKVGGVEKPATVYQKVGGVEVPLPDGVLQYPYGQLARNEIKSPAHTGTSRQYSTRDANCTYRIFKPTGTPPAGGWPCLAWVKTNYFISGTANDILSDHPEFLAHALHHGWAVAAIGVYNINVLSGPEAATKFPRQIMDVKGAVAHIKANAATDGINPNKIVASGQSSGAYLALGAVVTKDVDDAPYAGDSWDFRMSGWGYAGADPTFAGALLFQPPVNLSRMWKDDPGDPYHDNAGGVTGNGAIRSALNLLRGVATNTGTNMLTGMMMDLNDIVAYYSKPLPPIRIHYSPTDGVVPGYNITDFEAAMVSRGWGSGFTKHVDGNLPHQYTSRRFSMTWKQWLDAL